MGLIAGFSCRKRKAEATLFIGPVTVANENSHENVHMGSKKGKGCKWHCMQQMRKETMGVTFAVYTCVQMDAILPTIIKKIKLLIIFFYF